MDPVSAGKPGPRTPDQKLRTCHDRMRSIRRERQNPECVTAAWAVILYWMESADILPCTPEEKRESVSGKAPAVKTWEDYQSLWTGGKPESLHCYPAGKFGRVQAARRRDLEGRFLIPAREALTQEEIEDSRKSICWRSAGAAKWRLKMALGYRKDGDPKMRGSSFPCNTRSSVTLP